VQTSFRLSLDGIDGCGATDMRTARPGGWGPGTAYTTSVLGPSSGQVSAALIRGQGSSPVASEFRRRDQMHMIGHQAISPDRHAALFAPLAHQLQIGRVILLAKERRLPTVPSLGNVMRHPGNNDTCQSSHAMNLAKSLAPVNSCVCCPRNSCPGTPSRNSTSPNSHPRVPHSRVPRPTDPCGGRRETGVPTATAYIDENEAIWQD
jgi:hypothetical protein